MSATKKIIGSLAVATAVWLGGTAYVSSNTEGYLQNYVERSNNLYAQNGVQVSVETFEKGFFSSNAKMKVDFVDPSLREVVKETVKLPIEVDYTLENGPLLFSNGLGVGMSRIKTQINLSDYLVDKEAFKEVFQDDIRLESSTTIDLSKNASFKASTNKIVANMDGEKLHISPLVMEGDMNMESFQGQVKMLVESITGENKTDGIEVKNVVLEGDITKFYENGFYLGDFVFDIESVSVKTEEIPFELDAAKVHMDMNIDENADKTINMKLSMDADTGNSKLPEDFAFLKKFNLAYALNGVKLEGLLAFQDFTQELQAKQQAIMTKLTSSASGEFNMEAFSELEKLQVEAQEQMLVLAAGLLQKESTNFALKMNLLDKKANKSHLDMKVAYVGDEALPTTAKELSEKFEKDFLNLMALDVDVALDKAYISNLPEELKQQLDGQLQMGAMFGIVQDNNTSYSFDAKYKAKSLTINGQDRSEMLQMLEMGLAQ